MNSEELPEGAMVENYISAINNKEAVEEQIKEELTEHRYVITTSQPTLVSALGAIKKPGGGIRLIHDCSRPTGKAINDYAHLEEKIKYQTVNETVKLVKQGNYMAKVDLKSAYRSVALHPSQYQFTGLKWKFKGNKMPTYMMDTRLCFGARLSPGIFHRLTQAVCRIMLTFGFSTSAYLDDFFIVADSKEKCNVGVHKLITLLRELGFAIAYNKVSSASTSIVFLGVLINSITMTLHLPEEKVIAFKELLLQFRSRKRASCRQLQALAGKLSWSTCVVRGGRIFLNRILQLLRPLRRTSHKALLDSEFQNDIDWWLSYIDFFNCTHIIPVSSPPVPIFTDACQEGAGLCCPFDWAYINWRIDVPQFEAKHINVKESAAAIAAIHRWAPLLRGQRVTIYTDNITTRAAISKGRTRDPSVMDGLRSMFWTAEQYNITIECKYIAGKFNIYADAISRITQRGHLLFWLSVLAGGREYSLRDVAFWSLHHCSPYTACYLFNQAKKTLLSVNWTGQWHS